MRYLRFVILFFFLSILGCSHLEEKNEIVTTIYPFKSILQEIVGNRFEIKSVLPAGADPHTYEILPSDYQSIQNAKVFFFGSMLLDGWAANIDVKNKVEMLNLVPKDHLIEIKVHNFESGKNKEEYFGVDPHFWTDPVTVKAILPNLVNELIKIDPNGEKEYRINENNFSKKLSELDLRIKKEILNIKNKNVFTGHPFYNYFFERYGFNIVGSLEVAPGIQPTPKIINNLIDLMKKANVGAIFTNKQHSDKPAKILAEATGISDYVLDPMGGVEGRMTYEEIILQNLSIIKYALK
jgi:zinc transport system substrate-binding protein